MNILNRFLNRGNERSIKAKKNILYMLFLKGGNILIGLLLVPMTLGYIDSERYGIWMTLSSMVAWIHFFDIGISNGLKNRLAEALANKNYNLGKKYVSTTYAMLTLIFIPLMFVLLCIVPFVDWVHLLNLSSEYAKDLLMAIYILVIYFCINFILNTINVVILAEQRPADASLRNLVQQLLSLMIIYVLTLTTEGSLIKLCMALCLSPLFVVLMFNITLFRGRFRNIAPHIKYVDFKLAPDLMKLGVKFFIISIAGVIQYQMINFLILRYFGADEVASYNVSYKYFSILTMVWSILTTPLWVAFTDAIAKKDYKWIRRTLTKYNYAFLIFIIIGGCMLWLSNWFFDIWVGDMVVISIQLSFWILLYNISTMFSNIYVSFINGTGKLNVQTYACLLSPLVFICIFWGLHNIGLGISSILIASIVCNFNGLILAPIQTKYFLKKYESNG